MMSEKVPWEAGRRGRGRGRQRDSEMSTGVVGCLVAAAGLINLIAGYSYRARVNPTGLRTASRASTKGERSAPGGRRAAGWGNAHEDLSEAGGARG